MMTMAFTIGLTTEDLKNHFATELRVPSNVIQIMLSGKFYPTLKGQTIVLPVCNTTDI